MTCSSAKGMYTKRVEKIFYLFANIIFMHQLTNIRENLSNRFEWREEKVLHALFPTIFIIGAYREIEWNDAPTQKIANNNIVLIVSRVISTMSYAISAWEVINFDRY